MFSVVIVPRNTIVLQKREELVTVFLETLSTRCCRRALKFTIHVFAVEETHVTQIFSQEVRFETSSVDLFHDAFKKLRPRQHEDPARWDALPQNVHFLGACLRIAGTP